MNIITLPNKELLSYVSEQLNQDKHVSITVVGSSMKPFFKDSITHVTLKKETIYRKRDVILFKIKDTYVLHRIRFIKAHTYYCQGDNTFTYEKPTYKDIVGKVISFETYGKVYTSQSITYHICVCLWIGFKPVYKIIKRLWRKK